MIVTTMASPPVPTEIRKVKKYFRFNIPLNSRVIARSVKRTKNTICVTADRLSNLSAVTYYVVFMKEALVNKRKSGATRQAEYAARMRADGYNQKTFWLTGNESNQVGRLIVQLRHGASDE